MIIHYEMRDGVATPVHIVTHYHDGYRKMVEGDGSTFVEVTGRANLSDIVLEATDGGVRAYVVESDGTRRYLAEAPKKLPIVAPASLVVGVEAAFTGVPAGARILLDRAEVATMDDSGRYEVTVRVAGHYRFCFVLEGFRSLEVTLEATESPG